jgi:hypothetical protein
LVNNSSINAKLFSDEGFLVFFSAKFANQTIFYIS